MNIAETNNAAQARPHAEGRLLALDFGTRRIGVAVSDELQLSVRPLPALERTSWKRTVRAIAELRQSFDVQTVVFGLPLSLDGSDGEAAREARRLARNLSLTLGVPVLLQDERLSSRAAEEHLRELGLDGEAIKQRVDSEAAAIILRDFLAHHSERAARQSLQLND